jgi:hypothetical protein
VGAVRRTVSSRAAGDWLSTRPRMNDPMQSSWGSWAGRFGVRVTDPRHRHWFEPKREPKRPEAGYLRLQIHDPGDIVWFREMSVRPWPNNEKK